MREYIFLCGIVALVGGIVFEGFAVAGGLLIVASAIWHLADSISYSLGATTGVEA